MQIVFKLNVGATLETATVGDTNFKRHYPEVNHSMLWLELLPYVEQATDLFVVKYIGPEVYDALTTKYQNGETLSTKEQRLLELLQRVVAYYTIAHALPKKLSVVSTMGNMANSPEGGALPVSQWSHKNTLWSVTKDADRFLDEALAYLQTDVDSDSPAFSPWKSSTAYTYDKADYFRSTQDFQGYHNIAGSHRTYRALLPYIKKAQDKYIIPILGETQHNALVTAIKNNNATEIQKKLIEAIRKCLAEYTIFLAVPALTVLIEEDGMKLVSRTDNMDAKTNVASAFFKEAAAGHQLTAGDNGRTFQADLIDFLGKNAASFPYWMESEYYLSRQSTDNCEVLGGKSVWL